MVENTNIKWIVIGNNFTCIPLGCMGVLKNRNGIIEIDYSEKW